MATSPDIRAYFFYANWCGPCQRVKPVWDTLKTVYFMNGIVCTECDFDQEPTKDLMQILDIQTVPTLIVLQVPEDTDDITTTTDFHVVYRGDSKTIPATAASVVHTFSMDEDF